jgi:hypothetical protein
MIIDHSEAHGIFAPLTEEETMSIALKMTMNIKLTNRESYHQYGRYDTPDFIFIHIPGPALCNASAIAKVLIDDSG